MNQSLHKIFVEELSKLYTAENKIVEALEKMVMGATNEELEQGFKDHLEQSKEHIRRLEEVASSLGENLTQADNPIIEALLSEGDEILNGDEEDLDVRDAALIAAAQKVEHYEIASYGTVIAWAKEMDHGDVIDPLVETLNEEKETDEKLSDLAEGGIFTKGVNEEASEPEE